VNYGVAHAELNILVAENAKKDGALMQGQVYPDYAVPGTTLGPGALPAIPTQWPQATAANKNIKFVVMDGGGNDVLINNMQCKNDGADKDPTCQMVVANSLSIAKMMMSDMKAAGVTEVVYFFYPHPPIGGADIDDYTIPMLQDVCAGLSDETFQCRVVDTVPIFMGHDDWYASDDIHANDTGEQAIADAVWKQLKDDCAAQPESSGCCTP
jgi:lysophospholipase L1-like esterase